MILAIASTDSQSSNFHAPQSRRRFTDSGGGSTRRGYDRGRRPGGILPAASVTRVTITTNRIRNLSHPPNQHTRQPSMSSPSSTARKSSRNFVSTCIVSEHAWLWQRPEVNNESVGLILQNPLASPFTISLR